MTNLQQQIVALQKEKDSAVELWQMSMGAIDALELEIKARSDTKDAKLYENELRKVQRSYTDVINALQEQVLEARKKYSQQESMWMTSKEATETLRREKEEAVKRFEEFQQSAQRKGWLPTRLANHFTSTKRIERIHINCFISKIERVNRGYTC